MAPTSSPISSFLPIQLGGNSQQLLLLLPCIYSPLPFPFFSPWNYLTKITPAESKSPPSRAGTIPANCGLWKTVSSRWLALLYTLASPLQLPTPPPCPRSKLMTLLASYFPEKREALKGNVHTFCHLIPGAACPPLLWGNACLAGLQGQTRHCALQASLLAHSRITLQKMLPHPSHHQNFPHYWIIPVNTEAGSNSSHPQNKTKWNKTKKSVLTSLSLLAAAPFFCSPLEQSFMKKLSTPMVSHSRAQFSLQRSF